jgi:glycosyltransferase involved in cell wall biosynthesis
MHERGAGGGVDRVFWELYNQLVTSKDLELKAFFFRHRSEQTFSPGNAHSDQFTSSEFCLGSTSQPGYRRLWNVRRSILPEIRDRSRSSPVLVASHFALYASALLPNLSRLNHVVHFHGPWAAETAAEGRHQANVAAKRVIEHSVYSTAKAFVTLSKAFKNLLISQYGVDPDLIHIVPGGVDLERFSTGDRDAARVRLAWPKQASILFCVRRLVRRMGLESLIEAFAAAAPKHADAFLIIGGTGPLRMELEAKVKSHNLSDQVLFTGFIPEADLPSAYQAADLSIVPSQNLEGFGLTAVESLACGTPVLVTPVGGLPEILDPLESNLVLPSQDTGIMADRIDRFLGGKMPVPSTARCREHVEANFAWPKIAQQVKAIYRRVAGV